MTDVSAELHREKARREQSEKRLELFIEHAPAAIAMFDREMRYLVASRRWLADYGLEQDVLGRCHYDVFPEVPARWREVHERALGGEVVKSDEDRFQRANGVTHWRRWEVRPWHDETGQIGGIIVFAEEITGRKQAEEGRLNALRLKQTITDNAATGIIMQDAVGCCTFMNPAAEEITGFKFEELKGKNVHNALHHTHPDGRPYPASECEIGKAIAAMRPIRGHEDVFVRKDGTFYPVMCNASPVQEGDVLREVVVEFRDITEEQRAEQALRESERRLRFVMDSMPQKIFAARPNGDVDYLNPQWTEFTGLSFGEIRDWGWTQFIHPEDVAENVRLWRHSIETGEPFQFEQRVRRRDGEYRWHLSRAVPLRDAAGQVVMWVGSNTEIHEVKQSQQALKEADRSKDEFLAMLGHELRNPLAAIRNGLHILLLAKDNEATVAQVKAIIDKQVGNLTRLVDDLLDVSRITRGKIQLRKEPVLLRTVLNQAIESVRPLIEAQHHTLTILHAPTPIRLDADPTRLEQILVNLLTNAAKYTKQGGYVTLTVERHGAEAVIRVRDNGVGIRPDLLPKMFELFVQSDRSLDRSQGGLGIGLTLVRKLVTMHGGSVEASSDGVDKGSEFIVRLPALPAGQDRQEPAAELAVTCDGKSRVLLVEDSEDVANTLRMLLESWGYKVRVAGDGPSALVAYRAYQADIVLLDIGLPGMNGYDVARQLRREQGSTRPFILAVTGYGQEDDKQRSAAAGFDYHMTKPVEPSKLQEVLSSAKSPMT